MLCSEVVTADACGSVSTLGRTTLFPLESALHGASARQLMLAFERLFSVACAHARARRELRRAAVGSIELSGCIASGTVDHVLSSELVGALQLCLSKFEALCWYRTPCHCGAWPHAPVCEMSLRPTAAPTNAESAAPVVPWLDHARSSVVESFPEADDLRMSSQFGMGGLGDEGPRMELAEAELDEDELYVSAAEPPDEPLPAPSSAPPPPEPLLCQLREVLSPERLHVLYDFASLPYRSIPLPTPALAPTLSLPRWSPYQLVSDCTAPSTVASRRSGSSVLRTRGYGRCRRRWSTAMGWVATASPMPCFGYG